MGVRYRASGAPRQRSTTVAALAGIALCLLVAWTLSPTISATIAGWIGQATAGGLVVPRGAGTIGSLSAAVHGIGQSLVGLLRNCLRTAGPSACNVVTSAACLGYVERAQQTVVAERESVAAERAAFESFADDVASMPATRPAGPPSARLGADTGHSLAAVRERYRETVLSAPGHDRAYDETLTEHMAAEFGASVASVVAEGGTLTPQIKQLLVDGARESATRRTELLEALDREHDSVATGGDRLAEAGDPLSGPSPWQQSFTELVDLEGELRAAERECTALLTCRQQTIQTERQQIGSMLQEYLYADLESTFPVLHATLERLETLRERRRAVTRAVTARV